MASNKPDTELHQYVIYDSPNAKRKRIVLDDYAPPQSLSVHLSKIDMPELRPRPSPSIAQHGKAGGSGSPTGNDKEKEKKGKGKDKEDKKAKGKDKGRGKLQLLPLPPAMSPHQATQPVLTSSISS